MIKVIPLSNAITIVFTLAYILCGLLALSFPDLFWGITENIAHALNLEPIKATSTTPRGSFLAGIIYFAIYVWTISCCTSALYNRLAKKT